MIRWFATKGSGTNEAARMEALLSGLPDKRQWPFNKAAKARSFFTLLRLLRSDRPTLIVMEGTGIAGGLFCLIARLLWRVPYVFSSGDAIGPFVAAHVPWVAPLFYLYERALCRAAAGFIGWTPYLCGRALTFGCRRAVTAAGWPIGANVPLLDASSRDRVRKKWGVPDNATVVGLVGALEWNNHRQYTYGLELVRAVARLKRTDVIAVVIGGGSGMEMLRKEAGAMYGTRVILPGPVPLEEVLQCMSGFDLASLPQSTDGVGSFRYTTKLSEYAAARLPVITSRIPAAYDLGCGWMWPLPGNGPWEDRYVDAIAQLLEKLTYEKLMFMKSAVPESLEVFQREAQIARVTNFVSHIVDP